MWSSANIAYAWYFHIAQRNKEDYFPGYYMLPTQHDSHVCTMSPHWNNKRSRKLQVCAHHVNATNVKQTPGEQSEPHDYHSYDDRIKHSFLLISQTTTGNMFARKQLAQNGSSVDKHYVGQITNESTVLKINQPGNSQGLLVRSEPVVFSACWTVQCALHRPHRPGPQVEVRSVVPSSGAMGRWPTLVRL